MRQRDLAFYVNPLDPKFPDRLAWLSEHGIHIIGTDGIGKREPDVIERIANVIEETGMRVASVHGEPGLAVPHMGKIPHTPEEEDQAKLRASHIAVLERAAAWNAEQVVLHFRNLSLPWWEGVWWEEAAFISKIGLDAYDHRMLDLLTWLCDEADRRHLVIALENLPIQHQFGYRIDEIVKVIERAGTPSLGICLDTGHANTSNINVADAFRTAGRHLTTVHLNDNFGNGDPRTPVSRSDLHLVPGLGTINWPEAIRAMDEIGYQGPAVFEGVNTGMKTGEFDWEMAVEMTIANWRAFECLAAL